MRTSTKIATLAAMMALGAAPAMAMGPPTGTPIPANAGTAHMPASPGSQGQGTSNKPSDAGSQSQGSSNKPSDPGSQGQGTSNKPSTPGPHASLPAKAKAYGKYCQTESRKHVAGTPGTPFSACVTAMAKVSKGSAQNPRTACKAESKKHVAGQHGTPFSQCVSGAAKLLRQQSSSSGS